MKDRTPEEGLAPELAQKLQSSLHEGLQAPPPAPESQPGGQASPWPDGNGKHRHPRENPSNTGRLAKGAGPTAVHRTNRPQMPHSH